MGFADLRRDLETMARDLTSLEINTIVKDRISGHKMQDPPTALNAIAYAYAEKLRKLKINARHIVEKKEIDPVFYSQADGLQPRKVDNSNTTFNHLGIIADAAMDVEDFHHTERQQLFRIKANSKHLATIADKVAKGQRLQPADQAKLRKIWEIGTDVIVIQTVIQLDGDVINHVLEEEQQRDRKTIFELHYKGIDSALRNWQFLVETIASFLSKISVFGKSDKAP
jgi:hypothetical protein